MKGFSAPLLSIVFIMILFASPVVADMGVDTGEHVYVGAEQWDGANSDKIAPGALDSVDKPADEECYTWEADSLQGEWQSCGSGSCYSVYVEEGDASRVDSSSADLYLDFDNADFDVGTVGNEANITVNDSGIDHDATNNYDANKHVDHTGVTLTAGTCMSGGGDISENRTFNVDTAIVSNGDTTHIPTSDNVYDFCETTQAYWNDNADLSNDEISEDKINFSTACGAGNHYYLNGNDLGCEADDDIPEAADYSNLTAGRSLTHSPTGTIGADAELYTDQQGVWIEPDVKSYNDMFWFMNDVTIIYVWCKTDTGTVSLNIEDGSDNNILTAELVCDSGGQTSCASGCDVNTINGTYDNITGKTEDVDVDISATASTPGKVTLYIGFTIDD